MRSARHAAGFTLVELLVTITLLAILLALAVPGFSSWIRNSRVRSTAQVLQDGLRLAQAEAVRRNRSVTFFLTNEAAPTVATVAVAGTAATPASNWGVRTLPLLTGENAELIRSGAITSIAPGVRIVSTTAVVCFNPAGQRAANAAAGCTIDAGAPDVTYTVRITDAELELNVVASLGGRVRMCNPARPLSATNPEGCA